MFNSLEAYRDSGVRAAKALNENDHARYSEEKFYYARMWAYEKEKDKPLAQQAFDEGYKSERRVPAVSYFR